MTWERDLSRPFGPDLKEFKTNRGGGAIVFAPSSSPARAPSLQKISLCWATVKLDFNDLLSFILGNFTTLPFPKVAQRAQHDTGRKKVQWAGPTAVVSSDGSGRPSL